MFPFYIRFAYSLDSCLKTCVILQSKAFTNKTKQLQYMVN